MRFGIWMVAGILEKSKRLRKVLCFAILGNSLLSGSRGAAIQRGMKGAKRGAKRLLVGVYAEKERGHPQGHACPRAPRATLSAGYLVKFRASSKACSVPPPAGPAAKLRQATRLRLLGLIGERATLNSREARVSYLL